MNLVFNGEIVLYVSREKNSNRLPMSLEQNSLISSLYKLCFFFILFTASLWLPPFFGGNPCADGAHPDY